MASAIRKPIKGYEGLYDICSDGRVYSHISNKFLSNTNRTLKGSSWYQVYVLVKDGKKKTVTAHLLVANAFITNPDSLPQINHIDGNKHNNYMSNLEWCTSSENVQHAFNTGLKVHSVPLEVSQKNGKAVAQWKKDNAKITGEDWSEIAEAISLGIVSGAEIGRYYNVSRSYINTFIKKFGITKGEMSCLVA